MTTATKKQKAALAANIPPAAEQRQRIEYMELGVLLKFPKNPRGHDFVALGEAFKDRGFVTPLLLDETSGLLVEGHGRLEKLEEMRAAGAPPPARIEDRDGKWCVPVVRGTHFDNLDQARRHLLGANRIGEGLWDGRLTADMLGKLGKDGLAGSGFGTTDLAMFIAKAGGPLAPGAFPEVGSDLATEHQCPKCHYRWSGSTAVPPPPAKAKPDGKAKARQ